MCAVSALAQSHAPGRVNYVENADSDFDQYTAAPSLQLQFPNAYNHHDLYGISHGSWEQDNHPEWILRDQYGNWL